MRRALLFLIAASILGGGCLATSRQDEDHTPRTAVPTATMPAHPTPVLAPPAPASEAAAEVRTAKADLARRLDMAADNIALVSVTAWEWPDASLGVPEKGRLYIPVVTPGYIIVLEAGGREYEYHSDTHGRVVYASKGLMAR